MPNPMVRMHNIETDEIIDKEMTDAEFAKVLELSETNQEMQAEAEAKAAARQAILHRLGLSEEEARLLLG